MKQIIFFLAATLALISCGTRKGYFTIEGRFLNMNQGELYVYSPDGIINGIDTIKVNGGRFALEIPCHRDGQLMLVFPNFSEQPIFAQSGKSVDIKADASHLKLMEITGTDDNELMTTFRQGIATASPPEAQKLAEHFIRDNAKSPVAIYLLAKYFITDGNTENLKKAKQLLNVVAKEQPRNGNVARMENHVKMMLTANVGSRLPQFKTTDIYGKPLSNATLSGKNAIIATWASWNFDSQNTIRKINSIVEESNGKVVAIGINLDASKNDCKRIAETENYKFQNICDETLFDSKLLATLGMHSVGDNIIINAAGKIVARGVPTDDLEKYLK